MCARGRENGGTWALLRRIQLANARNDSAQTFPCCFCVYVWLCFKHDTHNVKYRVYFKDLKDKRLGKTLCAETIDEILTDASFETN